MHIALMHAHFFLSYPISCNIKHPTSFYYIQGGARGPIRRALARAGESGRSILFHTFSLQEPLQNQI